MSDKTVETGGWGWPGAARKAHYFEAGEVMALCGRWLYSGRREQGNDGSPDNCVPCRRKLEAKQAAGS